MLDVGMVVGWQLKAEFECRYGRERTSVRSVTILSVVRRLEAAVASEGGKRHRKLLHGSCRPMHPTRLVAFTVG